MVSMADQVRPDQIRVIIQMRTTPALAVAAFGGIEAAPALEITEPSVLSPRQLRDLLRDTAESQGDEDFDFEYGHGTINVQNLLQTLEQV